MNIEIEEPRFVKKDCYMIVDPSEPTRLLVIGWFHNSTAAAKYGNEKLTVSFTVTTLRELLKNEKTKTNNKTDKFADYARYLDSCKQLQAAELAI